MLHDLHREKKVIKVLLVEDDRLDARVVSIFSESFVNVSAAITHVTSVPAAKVALETETFDICLLDFWLGQQNCLRFLTDIESNTERMAKIVISNITNRQVDDMRLTVNGTLFIPKGSCSPKLLEEAIEQAILNASATTRFSEDTAAPLV